MSIYDFKIHLSNESFNDNKFHILVTYHSYNTISTIFKMKNG